MKVPSARFGEHRMFEQIGLSIEGLGDGFSWKSKDLDHSAELARDGWAKARAAILSGQNFLVVLDEITYPLIYGWLPLQEVLDTLAARPKDVRRVPTGRRCPQEIIAIADTVTEMKLIKHAFQAGIPAQRGIEDEGGAPCCMRRPAAPLAGDAGRGFGPGAVPAGVRGAAGCGA